jgi:hypothetical protein
MNRKEALEKTLYFIKLGLTSEFAIDNCPMCKLQVCKWRKACDILFSSNEPPHSFKSPFCLKYFKLAAQQERKLYWEVVKEHIERELKEIGEEINE